MLWGLKCLAQYGIPTRAFHFGGGLGDHLLCTAVFHELGKRGIQKCWMLSNYPEIFQSNPYGLEIVPDDWKTLKILEKIKRPSTLLCYGTWIGDIDKIIPPKHHMITEILRKAGVKGSVKLKPYWYQKTEDIVKIKDNYVCVQSTNTISSNVVNNKKWNEDRMQTVVNELSKRFKVVQIGHPNEDKLNNAIDYRGASLNESASLLSNALLYLGQEGFPMHLARAVKTRSVIIYGGRIKAWQSGYPCNENIETNPPCSPCWQNNNCDYDQKCMSDISVTDVLHAVSRLESRIDENLETITVSLDDVSKN